jgi:hypothetical protein
VEVAMSKIIADKVLPSEIWWSIARLPTFYIKDYVMDCLKKGVLEISERVETIC